MFMESLGLGDFVPQDWRENYMETGLLLGVPGA